MARMSLLHTMADPPADGPSRSADSLERIGVRRNVRTGGGIGYARRVQQCQGSAETRPTCKAPAAAMIAPAVVRALSV